MYVYESPPTLLLTSTQFGFIPHFFVKKNKRLRGDSSPPKGGGRSSSQSPNERAAVRLGSLAVASRRAAKWTQMATAFSYVIISLEDCFGCNMLESDMLVYPPLPLGVPLLGLSCGGPREWRGSRECAGMSCTLQTIAEQSSHGTPLQSNAGDKGCPAQITGGGFAIPIPV